MAYTQNYGDFLPFSLGALYPQYVSNLRIFRDPSTEDQPEVTGIFSYEYAGQIDPGMATSNTPIAWDRPGNHEGGGNVLFYDGSVKWIGADSDLGQTLGYTNEASAGAHLGAAAAVSRPQALIGPQQRLQPAPALPQRRAIVGFSGKTLGEPSAEKKLDILSVQAGEQAAQSQKELSVQQRAEYDRKLAESNVKRGNYDEASRLLSDALKLQPESQETKDQLDRVQQIAKLAPQQNANIESTIAAPAEPRAGPSPEVPEITAGRGGGGEMRVNMAKGVGYGNANFSVSAIKDYSAELKTAQDRGQA